MPKMHILLISPPHRNIITTTIPEKINKGVDINRRWDYCIASYLKQIPLIKSQ